MDNVLRKVWAGVIAVAALDALKFYLQHPLPKVTPKCASINAGEDNASLELQH